MVGKNKAVKKSQRNTKIYHFIFTYFMWYLYISVVATYLVVIMHMSLPIKVFCYIAAITCNIKNYNLYSVYTCVCVWFHILIISIVSAYVMVKFSFLNHLYNVDYRWNQFNDAKVTNMPVRLMKNFYDTAYILFYHLEKN
jgi:hypothetical protein